MMAPALLLIGGHVFVYYFNFLINSSSHPLKENLFSIYGLYYILLISRTEERRKGAESRGAEQRDTKITGKKL